MTLGAAYLAGLTAGVYRGTADIGKNWQTERTFLPTMSRDRAEQLMTEWERAVRQACTR